MTGLAEIFGPFAVLVVLVLWLAIIVLTLTAPFVLFSIAGSLRGIHRELRRANGEAVPAQRGGLFPNATVHRSEPAAGSLGHQLLR